MSCLVMTLLHAIITTAHLLACLQTFERYFTYLSHPGFAPLPLVSNGGPFKFFTYWTLFIHTVIFGLILVTDFVDNSWLSDWRDLLFNAMALPFGALVFTLFWSLYAIDKRLVRPQSFTDFEPEWKNQIIHTMTLLVPVLEMWLVDHKQGQLCLELLVMTAMFALYVFYILYIGVHRNDWVYPMLFKMDWLKKVAFMFAILTMLFIFKFLGNLIYKLSWT